MSNENVVGFKEFLKRKVTPLKYYKKSTITLEEIKFRIATLIQNYDFDTILELIHFEFKCKVQYKDEKHFKAYLIQLINEIEGKRNSMSR